MADKIRVNLSLSPEVHAYIAHRAKLTGSTVAATATDMIVSGMMAESDRLLQLEKLTERIRHDTN
jgi:hypothetical protein